jgi:hypothetical protein
MAVRSFNEKLLPKLQLSASTEKKCLKAPQQAVI